MTATILALSAGYAVLGALLLVMGLRSDYRWPVKGAAILVTSAFFIVAFYETRGLLGWAAIEPLPARFQLLWVRVLEPSLAYQEPGAIFLWVEALDENNVPSGSPRAHKLKYSAPLAERAGKAKEQIIAGNQQQGTAEDMADDGGRETTAAQQSAANAIPPDAEKAEQGNAVLDPEFLQNQPQRVEFAPLSAPLLPAKGAN